MKRLSLSGLLLLVALPVMAWAEPLQLDYEVLQTKPHDTGAFTQGLLLQEDGSLLETSGLYGRSFIQRSDLETGAVQVKQALPKAIFAEGVAALGDRVYVLTWRAGLLLVLDQASLQETNRLTYSGEGWGLTHNGHEFLMSDGSDRISFRDRQSFAVTKTLTVKDPNRRWSSLNELEYARGLLWANVWQTPYVLAIDTATGEVRAMVDFRKLVAVNSRQPGHTVLNGIAYDAKRGTFWITGKLWPNLYEVRIDLAPLDVADPKDSDLPKGKQE